MRAKVCLRFIHDPGHGWLEAPVKLCRAVGMTAWSDVAGGCAYFEEDCAAYELEKALKRAGMKAKLKHFEVDDFGEWLVSANWPYAAALRR